MGKKTHQFFTESDMFKFINVWKLHAVELRKYKRNSTVLSLLKHDLKIKEGIALSTIEIRNRINNLSKKYRIEKEKIAACGEVSQWKYYNIVHKVITKSKKNFPNETFVGNTKNNTNISNMNDGFQSTSSDPLSLSSTNLISMPLVLISSTSSLSSTSSRPSEKRIKNDGLRYEYLHKELERSNELFKRALVQADEKNKLIVGAINILNKIVERLDRVI